VNVPTAVNATPNPTGMLVVAGVTTIETTEAGVTVNKVAPLTDPRVALIVAVPVAREVATALEFTVTLAVFPETQVADVVRS